MTCHLSRIDYCPVCHTDYYVRSPFFLRVFQALQGVGQEPRRLLQRQVRHRGHPLLRRLPDLRLLGPHLRPRVRPHLSQAAAQAQGQVGHVRQPGGVRAAPRALRDLRGDAEGGLRGREERRVQFQHAQEGLREGAQVTLSEEVLIGLLLGSV